MGSMAETPPEKKQIVRDIQQLANLGVHLADSGNARVSIRGIAESSIVEEIKQRQYEDLVLARYRDIALAKG
ncbi:hypothetical protein L3054_11095 [Corynebacterium sp. MC-10]|nr:hypothetical protein [Corynebacterium parakroppenstedtii]